MTRNLLILAVAAALIHLAVRHAGFDWLALASKPVPVLCLALIVWREEVWRASPALTSAATSAPARRWLVAGLLFSALGDVILALPAALSGALGASAGASFGQSSFMAGLGAFLVAHLCYVAWFLALDRRWRLARLVGPLIYAGILLVILWPHLGPMLAPVLAYAVVITLMLWRALAAAQGNGVAILQSSAAWGAILFVLSDSLIALNRFVDPLPMATLLIMLTYWAGQCGIFLTHRRFSPRGA